MTLSRLLLRRQPGNCRTASTLRPGCCWPDQDVIRDKQAGVLAGVWDLGDGKFQMTDFTASYNKISGGRVAQYIEKIWHLMSVGKAFVLPEAVPNKVLSIASIGPKKAGFDEFEQLNLYRENVRWGMGAALNELKNFDIPTYNPDPCGAPDAAGEAVKLAGFKFSYPNEQPKTFAMHDIMSTAKKTPLESEHESMMKGFIKGDAQCWARYLTQMPPNKMKQAMLLKEVLEKLQPLGIQVQAYNRDWIVKKGMEGFLTVADGSCGEPLLLECTYNGTGDDKTPPVLLTAAGVTFDSGGQCLRTPSDMMEQPGNMAGAAVALSALYGLALLEVKLNVVAVIPLCENMIGCQSMKIGDVIKVKDWNVEILRTDLEVPVLLADALVYGQEQHDPSLVVNLTTRINEEEEATGGGAFGCYSNNDMKIWNCMREAGAYAGDRPWPMFTSDYYERDLKKQTTADIANEGADKATSCITATFLKKFMEKRHINMDITSVTKLPRSSLPPYLDPSYMTGRPTRTLIRFLQRVADGCLT